MDEKESLRKELRKNVTIWALDGKKGFIGPPRFSTPSV